MDRHEQLVGAIYKAIDEINEMRPPEERIDRSERTILIGEESPLDSLALVTLIASVEAEVEVRFEQRVSMIEIVTSDDLALPCTVADLAQRIAALMRPVAAP